MAVVNTKRREKLEKGAEALRRDILDKLFCNQARFPAVATMNDWYMALAYAVRDRLLQRWIRSAETYFRKRSRTVVYLSAEYLIGPQLGNNLINLGMYEQARQSVESLGLSLDDLLQQEEEPGLGNGGLGRLAACYMDSLATLQIPAIAYGIRYEFGIFDQAIRDGWQVENTDNWLRAGNPWEMNHPDTRFGVGFGGHTEHYRDKAGRYCVRWTPEKIAMGTPYDTPVLGYGVENTNMLRFWRAQAFESLDLQAFNVGDYYGAVGEKVESENISKILYPNDEPVRGKELRLSQQYFLVSCALQDMIRIHQQRSDTLGNLHRKYVVQLNDTHPALAVPELMRLLIDEHHLEWTEAWRITSNTFAYTNHTLLPEALETWSLPLFARLLPRHLEIIYEINRRFLDKVRRRYPGDTARMARMSLIDEAGEKRVRMANLACVGSFAINGVAKLHSRLLRDTVLRDFSELWPQKFTNKTNGITPRRFLLLANPYLSGLITESIGDGWVRELERLRELEPMADDAAFRERWREAHRKAKDRLAMHAARITGSALDPATMFDIQVKRIHEYKRQHLNVLHVITLYNAIRTGRQFPHVPRTFLIGGKAAPGYYMAKLMIKLANSVAETINADSACNGTLRLLFYPDLNVKNAEPIYPAADLSEQISTAGKEASGTGNMKFALNGALTIGTLDGANIEIRQAVGEENFFTFGHTVEEVQELKANGYRPRDWYEADDELREAIDMIADGAFSGGDDELFKPLVDSLLNHDDYLLLADYRSYVECQKRVSEAWGDQEAWTRMSILNTARMGYFSADRAVAEYCREIWHAEPVQITARTQTAQYSGALP
ncbi:MAG: glycogen/starch/alpha-glucan family phosphorylase [Chitinivibrionales bacterium]|nr:glycogen/starch/alpha-glucan family phosphorylase [Chitinivibrionales bacterium]